MKNTIYAAIAACLAMLATSGVIALATAAPAVRYERRRKAGRSCFDSRVARGSRVW